MSGKDCMSRLEKVILIVSWGKKQLNKLCARMIPPSNAGGGRQKNSGLKITGCVSFDLKTTQIAITKINALNGNTALQSSCFSIKCFGVFFVCFFTVGWISCVSQNNNYWMLLLATSRGRRRMARHVFLMTYHANELFHAWFWLSFLCNGKNSNNKIVWVLTEFCIHS